MHRFRRGIAVFATAATLFGMTAIAGEGSGVALAASVAPSNAFSDISTSAYAREIDFLAGLGFLSGDNGTLLTCTSNCTYRPDSKLTRAEFVKIVDMLAGLGGAAQALANVTPNFTDGSSVPSWAWGYVNVAQSNKYVQGYPDGSFGASNDITYAEALQVLLRIAGLGPAVIGPWPVGPVSAGSHYDMNVDLSSKDQGLSFNAPITRGEMAALVYDAYLKAPTGKVNVATGVFQDNLAPLIYSSPANTQTVSCTGQVVGVPSAHTGIELAASSLNVYNSSTNQQGTCAQQFAQKFQATPAVPAQFSQTVWIVGADGFAKLAGQTVTIVTDTNGNAAVVLVRNLSTAAGATGGFSLNNATASPPAGYTEVTIGTLGDQPTSLIQDSSGNYYLFSQDGKTQQIQNPATYYLNNIPVIGTDTDTADVCGATWISCDLAATGGGYMDLDNDESATPLSPVAAFNTIVNALCGGNSTCGDAQADVTWTLNKGDSGAASIYLSNPTYNHALLQSINAPSFTLEGHSHGNSHTVTVSSSTTITLNKKPASLSDLQPNDVLKVELQGDVSCQEAGYPTGTCPLSVISVAATRNVVTGSVTAISNGVGIVNATVATSNGQTQQITLNDSKGSPPSPVDFDTLTPGTPVEFALDSNGQAYWNLYNTSPNTWQPVVAEVMGTGKDNSGNYDVALNSAGATTNSLTESSAQAGLGNIVGNSEYYDPFVVVNTTNTDANNNAITAALAVWNGTSIYGGAAGTGGVAPVTSPAGVTVGPDNNGKIDFTAGANAGVTPLAPLFNLAAGGMVPDASNTCTTDSGKVYTTVGATVYSQCTDIYQITSLDTSGGTVTLQELDGKTGAPTGNQYTAYVSNGLTVFSQANLASNTSGQYLGVSGLAVGNKVDLWGGPLDKAGHVVDVLQAPAAAVGSIPATSGGEQSYLYSPFESGMTGSNSPTIPAFSPGSTTVLGMVKLPS